MSEIQTRIKRMNRRSFLKRAGQLCFGVIAAGMMTGIYSFKIERFWYQIKEVRLKVKNLPPAFDGWKIVQFSDIHLGFHYGINDLQPVVKMINNLHPDILFFTGDLIQINYPQPEISIPLLRELQAPRGGKWAVIGNHDFNTKADVIRTLESGEFSFLNNSHDFIESSRQRLYIAGIDDVMYGSPDIGKAVQGLSAEDCVMLLAHEPDIAVESSKHPISAQFSGHSHGGQVRIPFYGPIIKQALATRYEDGFYQVGESKMPLYVNRGIGTTNLAVRFHCRPEITLFHLNNL